jgi:hypothetical protein
MDDSGMGEKLTIRKMSDSKHTLKPMDVIISRVELNYYNFLI